MIDIEPKPRWETARSSTPSKRLIVCCDGTWNAGDDGQSLTNVAKISRCIADVDDWNGMKDVVQIVYYVRGVGTGTESGTGIGKSIRAAYTFICTNRSNQHDEIVLIGFSQGAFAARCVAQFVQDVGLLTKSGLRHLRELFKIWKHLGPADDRSVLEKMREKLQNYEELVPDVKIRACAMWDTVSAIGAAEIPVLKHLPKHFPKGTTPANVKLAVQALALGGVRSGNDDMTVANITLAWMNDDPIAESDSEARLCKVIATSRISSGLLKSDTSWMSWMMALFYHEPRIPVPEQPSWLEAECRRIFGNENQRPSDANHVVEYHHSLAPAIDQEAEKSKNDVLRIAEEIRSTRFGKVMFRAELLKRQAKDWEETIITDDKRYKERVTGDLLEEASYEAGIPICAILSAFYKLAERDAEDDEDRGGSIDNIYADDTQGQEPESWAEIWKEKKPFSQPATPAAMFRFKILDEDEASAARTKAKASKVELELTTERIRNRKPVLVFTRTYPPLMGRAHEMAKPVEKVSLATRISRVVSHAELPNRVPPCKKCCMIWKKKD
ncbi:hypothetical protein MBM_03811 [Drepanopeziza brunnea f. sp. 'multigermtubi' MB_m1]|uniref:T6SS Phospholipase effector Tle1-like catalytic domain-containing protein n=1 Tax=Marssonina brunnea f. sp. multigermtubi (strain MB_m1) TaxID=1072389 RepID=K1XYX5_MARBU|nr:uncharacterized protein MBM_03811 [Drepanopeziza brunnea f. sp. 'multigermtubi' MB_m1]EKD18039.1 hypothetical protein MBM_03811 [Drepanopeziza brunnea f. sp. 'multigermtubi' MB_m1]